MSKLKPKVCPPCLRSKRYLYVCRDCERKVCEHFCGNKTRDGMATCTACALRWIRRNK